MREHADGQDLNGDGDTNDSVIQLYDHGTGTSTNTGVVGRLFWSGGFRDGVLTFDSAERQMGQGTDLNNDGDTWDYIVRWIEVSRSPSTLTGLSSAISTAIADGSISNSGVGTALLSMLDQAGAMSEAGRSAAARNMLDAFIRLLSAQSDQSIDPQTADELLAASSTVRAGL